MLNAIRCSIVSSHRRRSVKLNISSSRYNSETAAIQQTQAKIDKSKVPTLNERDLEEQFVSGSGPGGQSVNKAVNCCRLKHKPTGLTVRVHQTRSLEQNRTIARQLMIQKLDNLYNGDESVENQKKRIALKRLANKEAERQRLAALKMEFKERFVNKVQDDDCCEKM